MIRWGDTFWGEGNRGFEVLSSNVKNGASAIDEFQRFITESSQCEVTYCKNLARLQTQLLKVQHVGTFAPLWHLIRDLLEKIAQAHGATMGFYQDLSREIHNYQDNYQKKVKTAIHKDPDVARTAELISQLNNTFNTVNKAKEQYHTIGLDYERAKRSGNNINNGSSTPIPLENPSTSSSLAQSALNTLTSSTRQFERLEKKYRQSNDDYRLSVEKYNSIRNEFEKRFYDACSKFQEFENEHVEKMLNFVLNYSDILKRNNDHMCTAQNEFHEKLKLFTGAGLVETFVQQKRTGTERPIALQFEEIDSLKGSLSLNNSTIYQSSVTPDITQGPSDELINFDGPEANVPGFQNHFSVASPTISSTWGSTTNMRKSDSNRALASSTSLAHQHLQNSTQPASPVLNSGLMSLSNPNHPLSRLQETPNDQTSNPFDVRIRRAGFKGLWPTNRKEKKEKKSEKKGSSNFKLSKVTSSQQQAIHEDIQGNSLTDETSGFNQIMGSVDTLNQISTLTKSKCPTPEPYTQSSPSMPNKGNNRPVCQSTIPFSSSTIRKSTSSSDSSDDDDDDEGFPVSKINFTIKPTDCKTPITEESDETKISNAMRVVDKNIGHFTTYSRSIGRKAADMSKSVSSGQILNPILPPPPPLPSRPNLTMPTSFTTDNFPPSSSFPLSSSDVSLINTNDAFSPRQKSMTITTSHQENIPPFSLHSRSMSITTNGDKQMSLSSADDDNEVAKTFLDENLTNKNRASAIPRPRQTMQPTMSSVTPSIAQGRTTPFIGSTSQSFTNGLMNSMDQRTSPMTLGASDQIPIAVAFQETIHVMMSGDDQTKWKIRILGDMLVSFPAAILNLLVDLSPHLNTLEFRLKNLNRVENIIANPQLVTQNCSQNNVDGPIYSFDMQALSNVLRNLQDKNRSLPFFNFGILKYEVKHTAVSSIPIVVSSQWTRTFDKITVQVNYRFKSSNFPELIRMIDDFVVFSTNILDGKEIEHSSPNAEWSTNEHKVSWKVPYTFDGSGKLVATIKTNPTGADESDNEHQQQKPLTTSSIIHVRFLAENALFSSIDFDFACRGYRISLLKKKIQSGKYQSEPDSNGPIQLFRRAPVDQHRVSLSTSLVA